LLFIYFY
jgi:hypothetical protein